MRKNKSGLIINMSSVAGRIGFPLSTAYCISKFGIEGLSQALRRELMLRNINVCLIEAGVVNTKFFSNMSDAVMSKDSAYADETKIMRDSINKIQKEKFSQASDVSKEVLKIINDGGKEFRYIVGNDAEAMIAALESSQDDQIKMDTAIYNIMKEWEN